MHDTFFKRSASLSDLHGYQVPHFGHSHGSYITTDLTLEKRGVPKMGVPPKKWMVYHTGWWFQPTPLKNDGVKVKWEYDIPNMMGK